MGEPCIDSQFHDSALDWGEWSVSLPVRFTPGERIPGIHCIGGWVGPRAGLDDMAKRKFLIIPGLELRPRSQSLCRLRCPGSSSWHTDNFTRPKYMDSLQGRWSLSEYGSLQRKSCKPLIHFLKKQKKEVLSQDKLVTSYWEDTDLSGPMKMLASHFQIPAPTDSENDHFVTIPSLV
jgi:hypothetical protein